MLCVAFKLFFIVCFEMKCSLLSSSSLEICIKDGNTTKLQIECEKKIVLALTLDGGQVRNIHIVSKRWLL